MTSEERYARGQVQTGEALALLEPYLSHELVDDIEQRILRKWQDLGWAEFDSVDRILTKYNLDYQWHGCLYGEYERVNLSGTSRPMPGTRTCGCPGCSTTFKPRGSGKPQLYCGVKCRKKAKRIRDGIDHAPAMDRAFVCRNGHDRTRLNTKTLPDGHRRCLDCYEDVKRRARERRHRRTLVALHQ